MGFIIRNAYFINVVEKKIVKKSTFIKYEETSFWVYSNCFSEIKKWADFLNKHFQKKIVYIKNPKHMSEIYFI